MPNINKLFTHLNSNLTHDASHFPYVVVICRDYNCNFVNAFRRSCNLGEFSKTSKKAVPLSSQLLLFNKTDKDAEDLYDFVFGCDALENAFCAIPEGLYELTFRNSLKFGKILPALVNVPNRSGILFHSGNHASDSLGCILLGSKPTDFATYIENSQLTLSCFMSCFKDFGSALVIVTDLRDFKRICPSAAKHLI